MATFFDWFRAFNREADVSPAARAVGNAMATRADNQTLRFWITIQEVADFTGISSRHAINKVDELARASWVERTRRGANGRASEYRLSLPKVNQSAHNEESEGEQTCTIVPANVNYSSGKHEPECTPTTPKLPTKAAPNIYPPDFEDFWKEYPKKAGKRAALKRWREATRRADPDEIRQGAVRYAESVRAKGTPPDYVKNAEGWLNDDRWTDEIASPAVSSWLSVVGSDVIEGEIVKEIE